MEDSSYVRLRVELSDLVPEGCDLVRVERVDETLLVMRPDQPMTAEMKDEINQHLAHGHARVVGMNPTNSAEEGGRPHPREPF